MKILKRGVVPEEKVHFFRCNHCNTELEAKQGECIVNSHRSESLISIQCPVCFKDIYKDLRPYYEQK